MNIIEKKVLDHVLRIIKNMDFSKMATNVGSELDTIDPRIKINAIDALHVELSKGIRQPIYEIKEWLNTLNKQDEEC